MFTIPRGSQAAVLGQKDTVRRYLELDGEERGDTAKHECVVVYSVSELIETMDSLAPDCIVISYRSEECESIEALHLIRKKMGKEAIPIVMTTTMTLDPFVRAHCRSICDAFLEARDLEAGKLRSTVDVVLESRKPRVLVVDDDERMRNTIARVLVGADFEMVPIKSGLDAVQHFFDFGGVDLVICDLHLDDRFWKGPAVIGAIRRINPFLPIIVVSGDVGDREVAAVPFAKLFNVDLLAKPFDADQLRYLALERLPNHLRP